MMRKKIDEKRPRPVGFPSDSHPLSPCRGCSSRMRLMGRCRECGLFTACSAANGGACAGCLGEHGNDA